MTPIGSSTTMNGEWFKTGSSSYPRNTRSSPSLLPLVHFLLCNRLLVCLHCRIPVAIEKREDGEEVKKGPSIEELVSREQPDQLDYMGWEDMPASATAELPLEEWSSPQVTGNEEQERMVYFHATVDKSDEKLAGKPIIVGISKDKVVIYNQDTNELLVCCISYCYSTSTAEIHLSCRSGGAFAC